ncbi:hypothetical protein LY13_004557 [Prauserella aidingensis]|nr:hypothetical protein [Prauserella aidingensis]
MVHLHMPIDTALTITDDGCELDGYGPIPAPIARDIMTNPAAPGAPYSATRAPANRSTWAEPDDDPTP